MSFEIHQYDIKKYVTYNIAVLAVCIVKSEHSISTKVLNDFIKYFHSEYKCPQFFIIRF